jgi:glycosyltransferase involved in cell wall biosynthesis
MEAYEREGHSIPVWKRLLLAALSSGIGAPLHGILTRRLKSVTYNPCFRQRLSSILRKSDMLLPNSEVERTLLQRRFGVDVPSQLVWNACRGGSASPPLPEGAPARYALCVGRIERRKNQLLLLRAAASMDLPVVLIGSVNYAEKSYWRKCRHEAARLSVRVMHIEATGWDQVWPYYVHAAVHAQPSWFETPGLSSLEAAAAGCPIVCTDQGSAREYFGNLSEYCSPRSEASLREALQRALSNSERQKRMAFVRERYTWEKAAEMTLQAYASIAVPTGEGILDAVA